MRRDRASPVPAQVAREEGRVAEEAGRREEEPGQKTGVEGEEPCQKTDGEEVPGEEAGREEVPGEAIHAQQEEVVVPSCLARTLPLRRIP